ncbi:MAG: glycosyltransferase family 39 protein [Deltaproteobacteria bacterium]|nr:glycosyltransferase family 39 protein [Deltaproteobacteria bacterium]
MNGTATTGQGSLGYRWPVLAAAAAVTGCISALLGYLSGPYTDDLLLAAWARDNSWTDILTLKAAPLPLYLLKWKFAVIMNPGEPYAVAHVWAGIVHGINCLLIFLLLSDFFPAAYAAAGAVLAAIYRPGNEAWLWAAAENDGMLCLFLLLTLFCWRRSATNSRFYLPAFLAFTAAMLTKPNAVFIVPCLAVHDLGFSLFGKDTGQHRAKWFAVIAFTGAGYAAFAFRVRGLWDVVYPEKPLFMMGLVRVGESILRSLLLVRPVGIIEHEVIGFSVTGLFILWLVFASPVVRFGLCWFLAFLAPPLVASGFMGGRYVYSGMLGLLVVLVHLAHRFSRKHPRRNRWLLAAALLWGLAHLAANGRDIAFRRSWGSAYTELRLVLEANKTELAEAGRLQVVNAGQPNESWTEQVLLYDLKLRLPLVLSQGVCSSQDDPCLLFRENYYQGELRSTGKYPSRALGPGVRFVSASTSGRETPSGIDR